MCSRRRLVAWNVSASWRMERALLVTDSRLVRRNTHVVMRVIRIILSFMSSI